VPLSLGQLALDAGLGRRPLDHRPLLGDLETAKQPRSPGDVAPEGLRLAQHAGVLLGDPAERVQTAGRVVHAGRSQEDVQRRPRLLGEVQMVDARRQPPLRDPQARAPDGELLPVSAQLSADQIRSSSTVAPL